MQLRVPELWLVTFTATFPTAESVLRKDPGDMERQEQMETSGQSSRANRKHPVRSFLNTGTGRFGGYF